MNQVQQIIFGLGLGAIYALVATGFSLIYRTMGLLSFVHPQYVMLGSVFGYTALATLGLSLWQAVVPVGVAAGIAALAVDQLGLRPIRHRRGAEISMILATVGWGIVLIQIVSHVHAYGTRALSLRSAEAHAPFHVGGVTVRWDTVVFLGIAGAIVVVLTLFLRRTRTGRALRAVGESTTTASLMGIDVERMFAVSACVSGFLGGVAGLFVGYIFVGGITAGDIGLKSLIAAVLGGFGSLPGALVGGLLLGVIDNLVAVDISSSWRDAIVFTFMISVLLVWPTGLLGRRRYVRS